MTTPTNGAQAPAQETVTTVPGPDVALDLDTLEREGVRADAFRFTHDGRIYEMVDPQEIDWQDLLSGFRNPALFIRYALRPEDAASFFGTRVPAWKMTALMERYQKHYGLPDLGNVSALRP
jgi:hypothetical protein